MEFRREDVLSALREAGSKGLKTKDIAHRLGGRSRDLKKLRTLLHHLESDGTIIRGRRRRYQLPEDVGFLRGRVFGYGRRVAVLVPSDGSADIRISGDNLHAAHHGDTVLARTVRGDSGEKEAQVVRVLEHAPSEILGQITDSRGGRLVHVNHDHRHKSVTLEKASKAEPGDYVLVRIGKWGQPYERTRGRVTEVLGPRLTPAEDFAGIVREFNLPLSFPQDALEEAEAIPEVIPESELKRRDDLTSLLTFTIDPDDAKDFDDAVSAGDLDGGALRVGVHIADVSYYVAHDSYLDHEAMARGRSVYLVDRVIPMLPSRLSSEMAALKPDVPRLAVSILMDVDKRGEVSAYEIKETVMKSKARLTYDEAQHLIDKGAGWRAPKVTKRIADALRRLEALRKVLRQKRVRRGSIELETPEVDIVLDTSGNTIDVRPTARLTSHNLIEELMILANETVSDHMSYLGRSFMYRVHEVPDTGDMKDLAVFAAGLGHRFRWAKGTSPRTLQSLLDKVKGRPEEYIVSMFVLRSLKKAVYSERNVGHFGLASKCYTHFTSPIRRYPDLVVHRLLKRYGLHKAAPGDPRAISKFVRKAAEIASIREMEGDEAERASIKARIAEFMEHKIGEEYWGVISGVKSFGFFVMLEENLVEGLVHVSTLGDDYYTPDSTGTMLMGTRGPRYFRVGDRVLVRVDHVDRQRREVDFIVLEIEGREGRPEVSPELEGRARKRKRYRELQSEVRKAQTSGRRRGGRKRVHEAASKKTIKRGRTRRPRRTGR